MTQALRLPLYLTLNNKKSSINISKNLYYQEYIYLSIFICFIYLFFFNLYNNNNEDPVIPKFINFHYLSLTEKSLKKNYFMDIKKPT